MKLRIISWENFWKLREEKNVLLIDIREKEEYEREHVEGAIWQEWESLEMNIYRLLKGKRIDGIVIYCDRGNTSLLVARDLARNGYPVYSINGGYVRLPKSHNVTTG